MHVNCSRIRCNHLFVSHLLAVTNFVQVENAFDRQIDSTEAIDTALVGETNLCVLIAQP